jgi:cytoskeleton protein RodZ
MPAATELDHSYSAPNVTRQLALKATEESWVRVRASDGRAVFSRTLKKGETVRIPIDPGFILDSGNAAGLKVEVEGVQISLPGARGGVVRNVLLDTRPVSSGSLPETATDIR